MTSIEVDEIGRISANFTVTASEPCYVYYAVALNGTATPNITEMVSQGPPEYPETETTYGQAFIYESLTTKLFIKGLLPQHRYTLFVLLIDRGSKSSEVKPYTFITNNRNNAADVSLKLMQSNISPYEIRKALDMVALVLSLPRENVVESKYSFASSDKTITTVSRLLQDPSEVLHQNRLLQPLGTGLEPAPTKTLISDSPLLEVNVLLRFNIIPVLTSESYPSPKTLGSMLN